MIERESERRHRGEIKHTTDIVYGVTSLKKGQVPAKRVLELNREHWDIENKIHYVRDVTYDEDRCRIRAENGPRMMASIRNLAIGISRLMGFRYLPDAIRAFTFCSSRKQTMALWGIW